MCGLHISCWLANFREGLDGDGDEDRDRGGVGGWGVACLSPLGRNHREWPVDHKNQLQKLSISVGLAADEEGRGLRESQTACFGLFDCDVITGLALKHGIKASVSRFVLYLLVILEFLVPVADTSETRVPELTPPDL